MRKYIGVADNRQNGEMTRPWVLVVDSEGGKLVTQSVRGPSAHAFHDLTLATNVGIVGIAFSRQEIVFVPDVRFTTDRPPSALI